MIIIFSLACVSAEENNNHTVNIENNVVSLENNFDSVNSSCIYNDENSFLLSNENNESLLKDTYSSFDDLQNQINNADEGSIIFLSNNYTYTSSPIYISKSITIEGNGFSLDGMDRGSILQINTAGNVVLNNITFKNANNGAIHFNKAFSNSFITNCCFEDNKCTRNDGGSAFHFKEDANNIFIMDSTFKNNNAKYGGAILFSKIVENLTIDNCKFINNNNAIGGGAIYFIKQSYNNVIINSQFINNNARTGGAISFESNVDKNYFINNTFVNNSAITANELYGGGAIYFEKDLTNSLFENNIFINNSAVSTNGGAIFIRGNENTNSFKNSLFINNSAQHQGGAIFASLSNNINITDCSFVNNAAKYGGSIMFNNSIAHLIINGSIFSDNNANIGGGALYFTKKSEDIILNNVNFSNNTANAGGAIFFENDVIGSVFEGVNFTNNWAKSINTKYGGGAIFIEGNANANIFNHCSFEGNNAIMNGGAITVHGKSMADTFILCSFNNNDAQYGGAMLFATNTGNLTVKKSDFLNNNAIGGGAIYFTKLSENNDFNNIAFVNNSANAGGALMFENDVINSIFEGVNFTNNEAKSINTKYGGGAIFIEGNANTNIFNNSLFDGNAANMNGGAIGVSGNFINNDILATIFNSNIANNSGGAINIDGKSTDNYFRGYFVNNSAQYGGAILFGNDVEYLSMSNVDFIDNNNAIGGGAIYFKNKISDSIIDNSKFINNKARSGGAIFFENNVNGVILLKDSFINNIAVSNNTKYGGGAIYAEKDVSNTYFENLSFVDNFAMENGGAININGNSNDNFLINIDFTRNCANNGGAVYLNNGYNTNIFDSTFTNNNPNDIYYNENVVGNVVNSTFNGSSHIIIGEKSKIYLINNTELDNYTKSDFFVFNKGILSLDNNNLNNVIFNKGKIISETSIICLNNESYEVKDSLIQVNAVCLDDNNNYIVGEFIIFDLGDSINYISFKNKSATLYYNLDNYGQYLVNASLYNELSNCTHKTSIIDYRAKEHSIINASDVKISFNEYAEVNVNLPKDSTGFVTGTINNEIYASVVKNGFAKLIIPNLDYGDHIVQITYLGDDNYDSANTTAKITVASSIIFMPDVVKYYGGEEKFTVSMKKDNNPIIGKKFNITINGVTYSRTTNSEGFASIALNLNSGNYTVLVNIDNDTYTAQVTIKPTVFVSDLTKIFRNDTVYVANFLDSQGNPLVDTNVTFNINGVFYERKTNENGTARLNINLNSGEYICTAINPVNGEMKSSKVTVISQFVEHDYSVEGKYTKISYVVRLYSKEGNIVGEGENVTFNVGGVFYQSTTNSTGFAELILNLMAGKYIITAEFNGEKISDNITIVD